MDEGLASTGLRFLKALAIVAGASAGSAAADTGNPMLTVRDGLGPLLIRSESPAQAMRLTPLPRAPWVPKPGEMDFGFMLNVASIWAHDPAGRYKFDFHMADSRIGFAWGFWKRTALEVSFNERRTLNAGLDQITLSTHELLNIDQNGREDVPKNDFRISIPEHDVEFDKPFGAFTRSIEVGAARQLADEGFWRPAATMSLTLRWETLGDAPVGANAIDIATQLTLGKRFGDNLLYGNFAYTYFDNRDFFGIPLTAAQFTGMFSYEWLRQWDQSLIVQYLHGEGVVEGLGELSRPSHEVHIGYKWRSGRGVWELGLIENIINFNNTPDFGIALAYTHAFLS